MAYTPRKVAKKRTKPSHEGSKASARPSAPDEADWHQHYDATEFADNMTHAAKLWQQIMAKLMAGALHQQQTTIGHSDPFHIGGTFLEVAGKAIRNPSSMVDAQLGFWRDHFQLWHHTTQSVLGKQEAPAADIQDRRFKSESWGDNAFYDYLRRSYLINSRWAQESVAKVEGLDRHTAQKASFFSRQLIDALAPSNFLLTNPDVMRASIESNGRTLVQGLQNLCDDIDAQSGQLRIRMTDPDAFELGKSLACTKGSVVFENDLMQLIQYAPHTPTVHQVPLLLIPAWINKYYILDLRPENSLVSWLVAQGYTVFMISWVNPDEALSRKRFDDYISEGPLAALDVIESITGSASTSLIGYCLGGTLTAITLAYLKAHKQEKRIASATYLTTMIDFAQAGELSVFIDDEQLESLEQRMSTRGYLDGSDMATTFNMLRANDLIWSFVVNNYLLGKSPFPFDLLYWNSDSTRMPATMHSFYLRTMYQNNELVRPGGIELLDTPIHISRIRTPSYILSTREDHIAPWDSTYAATQIYQGPVRFVLSQSGHVAGVINPPAKNKYGYWHNDALPPKPSAWLEGSRFVQASWWEDWHRWQQPHAGKKVKARKVGNARHKPIEDAPGAYVRVKV